MANWNELFKDKSLVIAEPNPNFVEFFEDLTKRARLSKVIDLGCGTGRHSLYVADKGFYVHAVDEAETALEHLRMVSCGRNIKISMYNLSDLSGIDEKYDLGICVNVLGHGRIGELERMFCEIERVINKGGYIFLVVTPADFIKYVKLPGTVEIEKNSYLGIDAPDGDIVHHFYSEEELRSLLKNYDDVRISVVKEFSPFLKKDVEHCIVIARK